MRYLLLIALAAGLLSCNDSNTVYEEIHQLEGESWHKDSAQHFTFEIKDTTRAYNFYYLIRNTLDYPYYNLYVKYTLKDSTGMVQSSDLQEVFLFNHKSGKPGGEERYFTGKSLGDIYDHTFPGLLNVHFRQPGEYEIILEQFMRKPNPLPEILSVGLQIEIADNKK